MAAACVVHAHTCCRLARSGHAAGGSESRARRHVWCAVHPSARDRVARCAAPRPFPPRSAGGTWRWRVSPSSPPSQSAVRGGATSRRAAYVPACAARYRTALTFHASAFVKSCRHVCRSSQTGVAALLGGQRLQVSSDVRLSERQQSSAGCKYTARVRCRMAS